MQVREFTLISLEFPFGLVYLSIESVSGSSTPTGDRSSPSNGHIRSTQDLRDTLKRYQNFDDFERQLQLQKDEYQSSIQRHIKFLDEVRIDFILIFYFSLSLFEDQ